jgi:hypothetical protein
MSSNPPQPTVKTLQEDAKDQVVVIQDHVDRLEKLFDGGGYDSQRVIERVNTIGVTLFNLTQTLDSILGPSTTPRWNSWQPSQPAKSSDSSGCIIFIFGMAVGAGLVALLLKR